MEQKVIYEKQFAKPKRKAPKLYFIITFLIAFSFAFYFAWQLSFGHPMCMRWEKGQYIAADCKNSVVIAAGAPIVPYDEQQYKIRQVNIDAHTIFTDKDGKPLVYFSKVDGNNEYFNAPGKHPITGETLQPYFPNK